MMKHRSHFHMHNVIIMKNFTVVVSRKIQFQENQIMVIKDGRIK